VKQETPEPEERIEKLEQAVSKLAEAVRMLAYPEYSHVRDCADKAQELVGRTAPGQLCLKQE
jgi:hypothetical protein